MKQFVVILVCALTLGLMTTACSAKSKDVPPAQTQTAPAKAGTQVANLSNFDIYSVSISPTNKNQWEANLLAQRTLPNGDVMDLMAAKTARAESWDLQVTDKYGNSVTWVGLPLNQKGQITLLPDGAYLVRPAKAKK